MYYTIVTDNELQTIDITVREYYITALVHKLT